jgi:hypothetical protein
MRSITLATAWHPRGELARFIKLLQLLNETYTGIAVSLPPEVDREIEYELGRIPEVIPVVTEDWSWGRFSAMEKSLAFEAAQVQYADFDRLLRWVETRPGEWLATLARADRSDCLIIGRTQSAYDSHPQALVQTEAISNRLVSHLLGFGFEVDVSAGSKIFSGEAARYLIENCRPPAPVGAGHALGTDAEWPVTLKRAGFKLDYAEVDGLDWESADQSLDRAANVEDQRKAAEEYDADPRNWARRVAVALEIVQIGLDAAQTEIHRELRE